MQATLVDKNFLHWAIQGADDSDANAATKAAALRREKIGKPVIYLGTGTCGLGAGAAFTLEAIKNYVKEKQLDVDIVEVGCVGLCVVEPLLDIQLPGRTRLMFQTVTHEKVTSILDGVFGNNPPQELLLAQFRTKARKAGKAFSFRTNIRSSVHRPDGYSRIAASLIRHGSTNTSLGAATKGYEKSSKTIQPVLRD